MFEVEEYYVGHEFHYTIIGEEEDEWDR